MIQVKIVLSCRYCNNTIDSLAEVNDTLGGEAVTLEPEIPEGWTYIKGNAERYTTIECPNCATKEG